MLIDKIADFRLYVLVSQGMKFEQIRQWVEQAEREYLMPCLGVATLAELQEAYDDSDGSDEAVNDVLEAAQRALALFAYYIAIPGIQVKMMETGLHALSNTEYKSAYQWQVGDYRESYLLSAYSAMERLYDLLVINTSTFPEWTSSTGYAHYSDSLLRNTREFSEVYSIGSSHITYVDLKPAIARAQDLVLRIELGEDFYNSLIDHLTGDDDSDSAAADSDMLDIAVKKLRPALAHLAIGHAKEVLFRMVNGSLLSTRYNPNSSNDVKAFDDRLHTEFVTTLRRNAMETGHQLLSVARKWLDEHAEDFPLYLNGPGYREDGVDERPIEDRMHNEGGMMMV